VFLSVFAVYLGIAGLGFLWESLSSRELGVFFLFLGLFGGPFLLNCVRVFLVGDYTPFRWSRSIDRWKQTTPSIRKNATKEDMPGKREEVFLFCEIEEGIMVKQSFLTTLPRRPGYNIIYRQEETRRRFSGRKQLSGQSISQTQPKKPIYVSFVSFTFSWLSPFEPPAGSLGEGRDRGAMNISAFFFFFFEFPQGVWEAGTHTRERNEGG
jgi:hypothetical protein